MGKGATDAGTLVCELPALSRGLADLLWRGLIPRVCWRVPSFAIAIHSDSFVRGEFLRCVYRMVEGQGCFSSTRPVVELNVYVAPPSRCLTSADQAEAVADTLLNSTLAVFLNP